MTKAPTQAEISKGQSDNTTPQKSTITRRLRTDLGRSVRVTMAIQLVRLTDLRAQPSHFPQTAVKSKGHTFKKIVSKPPYIDNKPTATPSGGVIKIDTHTA